MSHGHVRPNPDGTKARCGGPTLCSTCAKELAATSAIKGDGPGYCLAVLEVPSAGGYRRCVLVAGHAPFTTAGTGHEWSATIHRGAEPQDSADEHQADVAGNRYTVRTVAEGTRRVVDVAETRRSGLGVMLDPDASWHLAIEALKVAATEIPHALFVLDVLRAGELGTSFTPAAILERVPVAQLAHVLGRRLTETEEA